MRYFPRMREIEYQMFAEDPTHAPRIDYSWSYAPEMLDPDPKKPPSPKEKLSERPPLMGTPTQAGYYDYQNWVWYRRMFLRHIMFPHVFPYYSAEYSFGLATERKDDSDSMDRRAKRLTNRWSEPADRRTLHFEMTCTLQLLATRALVRRRSSCSR